MERDNNQLESQEPSKIVIPTSIEEQKIIGNYKLGKTLGKGTFGKVKEAIHIPTGEKVAVKIIDKLSIEDADDRNRINRQVQIMKIARHPSIIHLYEIIQTSTNIYLAIEFAQQGELFKLMTIQGRLKERAAGRIFIQILNAVEYLHRMGIAHRDLKPENILLDNEFNVKLVDFGLSNYQVDKELLHTACGSPCYAPPQMVAGNPYNGIIGDMWSLGIIFYGMVCGSLPFEEKTTNLLYKKVIEGFYVLPSDISLEATQVIRKLLVTKPQKRISIRQLRNLRFFKDLADVEPEIVGLIVGFHPMPIDNQILEKMKDFIEFNNDIAECRLKDNIHDNLTTCYYLTQKKVLREGNRTILDLQLFLQTHEKYAKEYGKQSLQRFNAKCYSADKMTPTKSKQDKNQLQYRIHRKGLSKLKYKQISNENQRNLFLNDKIRRLETTCSEEKKSLSSYRPIPRNNRRNDAMLSDRRADYHFTPKRKLFSDEKGIEKIYSKSKGKRREDNSHVSKKPIDLWNPYFRIALELQPNMNSKKNPKERQKLAYFNQNVSKLKEKFIRFNQKIRLRQQKGRSKSKEQRKGK